VSVSLAVSRMAMANRVWSRPLDTFIRSRGNCGFGIRSAVPTVVPIGAKMIPLCFADDKTSGVCKRVFVRGIDLVEVSRRPRQSLGRAFGATGAAGFACCNRAVMAKSRPRFCGDAIL